MLVELITYPLIEMNDFLNIVEVVGHFQPRCLYRIGLIL